MTRASAKKSKKPRGEIDYAVNTNYASLCTTRNKI